MVKGELKGAVPWVCGGGEHRGRVGGVGKPAVQGRAFLFTLQVAWALSVSPVGIPILWLPGGVIAPSVYESESADAQTGALST